MKIQLLVSAIVVSCSTFIANKGNIDTDKGASIIKKNRANFNEKSDNIAAIDNAEGNHSLTFNMAKCANDLAPFKDIYLQVYKDWKTIRSEKELAERFESMQQCIGKCGLQVALFKKDKKLVGFMPFFIKTDENIEFAVIYDTPVDSSERELVFHLLLPMVFEHFNIQKAYCFLGSQASEEIREVVKQLGFKEDFNGSVQMDKAIKHNPEKYTVWFTDIAL